MNKNITVDQDISIEISFYYAWRRNSRMYSIRKVTIFVCNVAYFVSYEF